ncbi:MAG: hypothetical protein M3394_02285 [Actinomycetota bacterium]|nr:hypothetical protein [Actinomycetota bacterium]
MLGALLAVSLGAGLVPAFADVYSTPGGEAAVGTNGETVTADFLAVSNGGYAGSYQGIALNTTGTASGTYAAASGTGCAKAPYSAVAVSGTGCADAAVVSASGTGSAGRNNPSGAPGLVSVSGAGCAKGLYAAASGTGCADGGYAGVSGLGKATGAVAVSAGGQASGGTVGVTGWGNASGTASVDADRTVGTGNRAAFDAAQSTGFYFHGGVNVVASAYQRWVVATSPAPDPVAVAAKQVAYAAMVAEVAAKDVVPTTGIAADEAFMDVAPRSAVGQTRSGCVPASTQTVYAHRGMPGYDQLYVDMGTAEANGTTFQTAAAVIRHYYTGPSQPQLDHVKDPADLTMKLATAVSKFDQGVILRVHTEYLPWWKNKDGTPVFGDHAMGATWYHFRKDTISQAFIQGWDSGINGGAGTNFHTFAHVLYMAASDWGSDDGANIIW